MFICSRVSVNLTLTGVLTCKSDFVCIKLEVLHQLPHLLSHLKLVLVAEFPPIACLAVSLVPDDVNLLILVTDI